MRSLSRAQLALGLLAAASFSPLLLMRSPEAAAQQQPAPLQSTARPAAAGAMTTQKVSADGWRTSLAWSDGREVQWRAQEAPGCDGSDVDLRMMNSSRASGATKLRAITFSCTRGKGDVSVGDREIGVVGPNSSGLAQSLVCVCKDRGGVRDLVSLDADFTLEGKGEQATENGCTYSGDFSNGQRTGQGVFSCVSGYRGEGSFQNGKLDGRGKEAIDGAAYEGEFHAGKYDGHGRLSFPDKAVYDGAFKNGLRDGAGTMRFADGSEYVGDWVADKRTGQGVLTGPKGEWVYDGRWMNDKREGEGRLSNADGSYTYVGAFHNDKREGRAKVAFADGRKFEGVFQNDQQIGAGALAFADGRRIEGDFKDHRPNGHAVETRPDATFDGQWVDGVLSGQATVISSNGVHFTGQFVGGKRNGVGQETLSDGTIEQCTWINDVEKTGCRKIKNKGVGIEYRGQKSRN